MKRLIAIIIVSLALSSCGSQSTDVTEVPELPGSSEMPDSVEMPDSERQDSELLVGNYIRENIKELNPSDPVLGGSWYVLEIEFEGENQVRVVSEDGHIQSAFIAEYSVDDGEVSLANIESEELEPGGSKASEGQNSLHYPIDNFESAVTLKPFGIYITPENSPVEPERFRGYHNAVDVEILEDRQDKDIPVYAVDECEVVVARYVSGYGGCMVLGCEIEGEQYTVLYGHLDINSFEAAVGDTVSKGQKLAILGEGYSDETDGERMHLHFGVRKGSSVDLRGYVQNKNELSQWVDPMELF